MPAKTTLCALTIACFIWVPVWGNESRPWDLTLGVGGTNTLNTGSSAETFYWGPFMRAGYQIGESLKARLGLRHTRDKFLYDGLGGIAKQSHTAISPGIGWDITDALTLDGEYTFRIGENSFREHGGLMAVEYAAFEFLSLGIDGSYSQQNYVFPDTSTKVAQRSIGVTFDAALKASKIVEFPLQVNYLNSFYNTNKSTYVARTASAGLTFRSQNRFWGFTVAGTIGSDSSDYLIFGGDIKLRVNPTENLSLRLTGTLTRYTFSADQTAKSKKAQGESLSPLGNTDAFYIHSLGFELAYAL